MQVSYYPGCSLHSMATEYDESIRAVCRELSIDLMELDDWNCCGASSAHFIDDELAFRLADRNLQIANQAGKDLLVPCAACFQRLKAAQKQWEKKENAAGKGTVHIFHINDFFNRPELVQEIRARVKRPLKGLRGVPYYGCLSQRPPKVTDVSDPENPTHMDELMETLGMEVCRWSYKTDCCGASLALPKPELVRKLSGRLFAAAKEAGAECIVTDCPLCQTNLDTRQAEIEAEHNTKYNMPVFYITELIALAIGASERKWWNRHLVDPTALLESKGLL